MEFVVASISQELRGSACVDVDLIRKCTACLTNLLSHLLPELRQPLSAGFALSKAKWAHARKGDGHGKRWPQLRPTSRCYADLEALPQVALKGARDNHGVVMDPAPTFDSMDQHGVLIPVNDASRAAAQRMMMVSELRVSSS